MNGKQSEVVILSSVNDLRWFLSHRTTQTATNRSQDQYFPVLVSW